MNWMMKAEGRGVLFIGMGELIRLAEMIEKLKCFLCVTEHSWHASNVQENNVSNFLVRCRTFVKKNSSIIQVGYRVFD